VIYESVGFTKEINLASFNVVNVTEDILATLSTSHNYFILENLDMHTKFKDIWDWWLLTHFRNMLLTTWKPFVCL